MFDLKRILVPVDFSACSERALGVALSFAFRFDAKVTLLHVTPRPGAGTYEDNEATRETAAAIDQEQAALRELYERVAGFVEEQTGLVRSSDAPAELRIVGGSPTVEILAAAEDTHAEMIIMGTHGRTSIRDFFVGSTAEQVVKNATCAVLAVKPDGYPYLRD